MFLYNPRLELVTKGADLVSRIHFVWFDYVDVCVLFVNQNWHSYTGILL